MRSCVRMTRRQDAELLIDIVVGIAMDERSFRTVGGVTSSMTQVVAKLVKACVEVPIYSRVPLQSRLNWPCRNRTSKVPISCSACLRTTPHLELVLP